jgi:hypothetical protein
LNTGLRRILIIFPLHYSFFLQGVFESKTLVDPTSSIIEATGQVSSCPTSFLTTDHDPPIAEAADEEAALPRDSNGFSYRSGTEASVLGL